MILGDADDPAICGFRVVSRPQRSSPRPGTCDQRGARRSFGLRCRGRTGRDGRKLRLLTRDLRPMAARVGRSLVPERRSAGGAISMRSNVSMRSSMQPNAPTGGRARRSPCVAAAVTARRTHRLRSARATRRRLRRERAQDSGERTAQPSLGDIEMSASGYGQLVRQIRCRTAASGTARTHVRVTCSDGGARGRARRREPNPPAGARPIGLLGGRAEPGSPRRAEQNNQTTAGASLREARRPPSEEPTAHHRRNPPAG